MVRFCRNCGNKLPEGAIFCSDCGQKQPEDEPSTPTSVSSPDVSAAATDDQKGSAGPAPEERSIPAPSGIQPTAQVLPSGIQPTVQAIPPGFQPTMQGGGLPSQPVWAPPGTYPLDLHYQVPPPSTPFYPAALPYPPVQRPRRAYPAPQTGLQKLLVRLFQPALATNAFAGIVLGGLLAVILGSAVLGLLVGLVHLIAPLSSHSFDFWGGSQSDEVFYALGVLPTHSPFRDTMQLLFAANGTASEVLVSSGSTTFIQTYNASLSGLLIIPALFLTLGGYLAASTDFSNQARRSLWRGAAIALPYTILLLIFVPAVNGNTPLFSGEAPDVVTTLTINGGSLLILCFLWGIIFGLLGASLKLGRGRWRQMISAALHNNWLPQAGATIAGALAAIGMGLALSLLCLYSLLAYTSFSTSLTQNTNTCYDGSWQAKAAQGLSSGPIYAADLFMYAFNAPVKISNPQVLDEPCYYNSHGQTTLSMLGDNQHLPPWTYAFLGITVISLFLGGRVSASIGGAQRAGPALLQGAAITIPFAILMMLLALLTNQNTVIGQGSALQTYTLSAGVSATDVLPWAFLSSVVLGALGGLYQGSALKRGMGAFVRIVLTPLHLLGQPAALLGARLCGRPRGERPTLALFLLYNAFFWTIILVLLAGAASTFLLVQGQTITMQTNHLVRDILSAVLVALPGLLLICAGTASLSENTWLQAAQPVHPMAPGQALAPGSVYPTSI